jgi:hypothetical protein
MSNTNQNRSVAEAFSGHRFRETYPHLSPDVTWVARGDSRTVGRDAVIAACDDSAEELSQLSTEFLVFRSVAEDDTVAVETVGRYVEPDGATSYVASCDLYDFVDGELARIVSYASEIDEPTGEEGR